VLDIVRGDEFVGTFEVSGIEQRAPHVENEPLVGRECRIIACEQSLRIRMRDDGSGRARFRRSSGRIGPGRRRLARFACSVVRRRSGIAAGHSKDRGGGADTGEKA
jgi:hypothetical protein